MSVQTYSSPTAFKQALEHRLRAATNSGPEFARKRQLLIFYRFLARIAAVLGEAMILKGGLVLELRLEHARATKDIDLHLTGSADDLLLRLQKAANHDLHDFLNFEITPDSEHPDILGDGVRYDGRRFRSNRSEVGFSDLA